MPRKYPCQKNANLDLLTLFDPPTDSEEIQRSEEHVKERPGAPTNRIQAKGNAMHFFISSTTNSSEKKKKEEDRAGGISIDYERIMCGSYLDPGNSNTDRIFEDVKKSLLVCQV